MSSESDGKSLLHPNENLRGKVRPEVKEWAKKMRREPAAGEAELWERLRGNKLGFRFRRQAIVRGWIADFWCPAKRLIVEIDGGSHHLAHKRAADVVRDEALAKKLDIRTLRVPLKDVLEDMEKVVNLIRVEMQCRTTGYLQFGKFAAQRRAAKKESSPQPR